MEKLQMYQRMMRRDKRNEVDTSARQLHGSDQLGPLLGFAQRIASDAAAPGPGAAVPQGGNSSNEVPVNQNDLSQPVKCFGLAVMSRQEFEKMKSILTKQICDGRFIGSGKPTTA
jgi:hypothetical protein